ncbi:uncharacterized protein TM35_000331690 [Trypanosoma theileri]|uniref:Uncharacterized protein n=1 Tax=Trypanosoma theileri TaxID=67003 RepID=A0A1X0NLS2_9TRYP|nr:uncharacterized protein TM35_000331690 [Trypanosoma theileri]ORC85712.1 hypothetical protein TM35_000331690 [Trypanosoma theileri]
MVAGFHPFCFPHPHSSFSLKFKKSLSMIFQASRFSASGRKVPLLEPRRSEACRLHTNPTDAAVEWSSNTTASFPLTVHTYTMTVPHAHVREALRHSLKYTPSHTTYKEEKKPQEMNNNNNRIPTAHKALTVQ